MAATRRSGERVLLFDMGGVLVDLGTPASDMSLPMSEEEFWQVWLNSPHVFELETGRIDADEFCRRMGGALGVDAGAFSTERFGRWRLPLYAEVTETVTALAERIPLALLSNTSTTHWTTVSGQTQIFDAFSRLFLSFEIGLMKPAKEIFEYVVAALGIPPQRIIFLDDAERNVRVARDLGIDARVVRGFADARDVLARDFGLLDA